MKLILSLFALLNVVWIDGMIRIAGSFEDRIEAALADPQKYCEFINVLIKSDLWPVQELLDDAEKAAVSKYGRTLIDLAASGGHTELVRLLVENKTEVNVMNQYRLTPIHLAVRKGYTDIVKLLLGGGATITLGDGWTLLHEASSAGHPEIVKLLLTAGADVDAADRAGCTSLYLASQNGHFEVVTILLASGADKMQQVYGVLPQAIAQYKGHMKIAALLSTADPIAIEI